MKKLPIIIISIPVIAILAVLLSNKYNQYQLNQQNSKQELIDMQKKIADLENKPAPAPVTIEKTDTIYKTTPAPVTTISVAENSIEDVVSNWSKKSTYILCGWYYKGTKTNPYLIASGSGTIFRFKDGVISIVTNKHVVSDNDGYGPATCLIDIPGFDEFSIYTDQITNVPDVDLAYIDLINPSSDLIAVATHGTTCMDDVQIGEKIVVLGYPDTGSNEGVTVTDGIISGTDGKYYTTSAKIESGNSGGTAVSVKHNCYIGIPSATVVGNFESLGRILSSIYVFSK